MRKLNAIAVLAVAGAFTTSVYAKDDGTPPPQIQWMSSLDAAKAEAQASHRPILLYLTADYCVYCKQMDKEAFVDSRSVLLSQLYIPCKMDGEHEGKPLIKKYDVKMYPYEAVVDESGTLLTPAAEYMDPDKYTRTLALDLPDTSLARLKTQTDPTSIAQLAVLEAERGDVDAAEGTAAGLPPGVPISTTTALDHALGSAYVDAKAFDKAVKPLSTAAGSLGDCHEAVGVHFLLADCYQALARPADAATELTAIQGLRAASKDEKKLAEKRLRDVPKTAK